MNHLFIFMMVILSVGTNVSALMAQEIPSVDSIVLPVDADGVQRGTIVLTSYSFSPNSIVITAGRPVELTLKNESFLVPHNFVIMNEALGLHHDVSVSSGDSVTVQLLLTTPGRYLFYCDKQLLFFPTHREEGMEGVLEVRSEDSP